MSSKTSESTHRLSVLRHLLEEGQISTQEELVAELRAQKFIVTQSTISRDLSRLNAIKTRDASGNTVYRLPSDVDTPTIVSTSGLKGLLLSVRHNGSLIVIRTPPGSASLVARQLDQTRPDGVLGTIAGDDTIFVAPSSAKPISETIQEILSEFN
jgi:transcriptional regulator of arginine metabolism